MVYSLWLENPKAHGGWELYSDHHENYQEAIAVKDLYLRSSLFYSLKPRRWKIVDSDILELITVIKNELLKESHE